MGLGESIFIVDPATGSFGAESLLSLGSVSFHFLTQKGLSEDEYQTAPGYMNLSFNRAVYFSSHTAALLNLH